MSDPQTPHAPPKMTLATLRPRLHTYLPGDVDARLDREVTPDDLVEVLNTLHSLHHNLGTYLPRSLVLSKPIRQIAFDKILADISGV